MAQVSSRSPDGSPAVEQRIVDVFIRRTAFMLVLPWSFFVVGERGLFVVLIGGKAAFDTWLVGRPAASE